MSFIFRLHKTGNVQLKGWAQSSKLSRTDIQTIPDTIRHGRSSKIGSSIPTPLARMYLFETAFQMIADNPYGDTMYHHLASDCLDLFQFIYMNADSEHLEFKKWDIKGRIEGLRNSSFNEHRQLADSLELAFNSEKLKETTEIYLIYYKNNLVGGTSPITGVYTSPNWKRIVRKEGWVFDTPIGDVLFDETPYAIYQRDEDFQLYMYRFVYSYNGYLAQQSSSFYNYFNNCQLHFPEVNSLLQANGINPEYTPEELLKEYEHITIPTDADGNTENLYSGKCAIVKRKGDDIPLMIQRVSDFVMVPTQQHFNQKEIDGALVPSPPPLVLVNGNHRFNYIDSTWDPNIRVQDISSIPLHQRKLPKFNTYKYPYITTGDFLEDVLIELPYNLDNERFFTGYQGQFKYLLPIKKEYFNFFSIEDLERSLSINKQGDHTFKVSLRIPIKNDNYIELVKLYDINDPAKVAKYNQGSRGFNIGFFPFYKVLDQESLNRYTVLLASSNPDLKLTFYKYENIINERSLQNIEESERTRQTKVDAGSTYFTIREQSFDVIEVERGAILKGLIVPKMRKITVDEHSRGFTFAIDFGTSNTHIVYSYDHQDKKIESLKVGEGEDRQMVLLSELDNKKTKLDDQVLFGMGQFVGMDLIDREFMPSFVTEGANTQFPIRTAVCENKSFRNDEAKLFGNINIGFSLERDTSYSEEEYQTNIKWMLDNSRSDHRPEARIKAFFEQIMWMVKNKILLNQGKLSPTPDIITMIPLSMRLKLRGKLKNLWQEAADEVFGKGVVTLGRAKFESITPYFSAIKDKSRDALNIDIGGGTTDIFFLYKTIGKYYSTSYRFAGNDIWGDGIHPGDKTNGFFRLLDELVESQHIKLNDGNIATAYGYFKGRESLTSADVCSFLFHYDEAFKFSNYIKNHPPLVTILCIHLAAILYQVAQLIKLKQVPIPEVISYSGKGSEYLKLISNDQENITQLTKMMLELFTGLEASRFFEVQLASNPKELTAEGAIKEKNASAREKIVESDVENVTSLGFAKDDQNDPLATITVEELSNYRGKHEAEFKHFIEQLQDPKLKRLLREFDITFKYDGFDIIDFMEHYGTPRSYNPIAHQFRTQFDEDEEIKENPFFWFFKDTLYELSKELYTKA